MHGPPKPRTSIAFDLRQEPGAGKPHAGICAGGPGNPVPYRYSYGILRFDLCSKVVATVKPAAMLSNCPHPARMVLGPGGL